MPVKFSSSLMFRFRMVCPGDVDSELLDFAIYAGLSGLLWRGADALQLWDPTLVRMILRVKLLLMQHCAELIRVAHKLQSIIVVCSRSAIVGVHDVLFELLCRYHSPSCCGADQTHFDKERLRQCLPHALDPPAGELSSMLLLTQYGCCNVSLSTV